MTRKPLSERRTPDRVKMAAAVEELISDHGCTFTRSEGGTYPGPKCVQLRLTAPGGLELTVAFNGGSWQPNVYVLSWHMSTHSPKLLNEATFGGSVNPHHKRKATYVAHGFDDLYQQLKKGLTMAQDGTAYLA